jgi:hypothetical protein
MGAVLDFDGNERALKHTRGGRYAVQRARCEIDINPTRLAEGGGLL